jgi:hypothetical protein
MTTFQNLHRTPQRILVFKFSCSGTFPFICAFALPSLRCSTDTLKVRTSRRECFYFHNVGVSQRLFHLATALQLNPPRTSNILLPLVSVGALALFTRTLGSCVISKSCSYLEGDALSGEPLHKVGAALCQWALLGCSLGILTLALSKSPTLTLRLLLSASAFPTFCVAPSSRGQSPIVTKNLTSVFL